MGEQLSVINLVVQASVPVQIVIALLLLASLYSWMIIFRKRFMIGRSRREADQFENQFWSGGDLAQLYRAVESHGVKIYVDPKSLIYLDGMILDYQESLMQSGFVFDNPNAKKACGCGTSFTA